MNIESKNGIFLARPLQPGNLRLNLVYRSRLFIILSRRRLVPRRHLLQLRWWRLLLLLRSIGSLPNYLIRRLLCLP